MRNTHLRYWFCQVLGWGGWAMLNVFFVYLIAREYYFSGERGRLFFAVLLIEFVWYILATHLLRTFLKRIHWIRYSTNKVIGLFVASVIITGLISYNGARYTARITDFSMAGYEKEQALNKARSMEQEAGLQDIDYFTAPELQVDTVSRKVLEITDETGWYRDTTGEWQHTNSWSGRFWWDLVFTFILIALWLLLYMVWHYVQRNRKTEVDKISLEKMVKELEIKTIKSHINPHFIFNSLNSIRSLVEENPQRARKAITELSNILRSSLQVEKMETVPLKKELSIVNDFLALEQMRFEERLHFSFDIEDDALQQPIPPMMLQTLVENAIKHGIGRRINGGVVRIIAKNHPKQFELLIQNTGQLSAPEEGFGIKSTRDRLRLVFGEGASLKMENIEDDQVQVRITIPRSRSSE